MARALANLARRTIALETGQRTVDLPVDGAGHIRRLVKLDRSAVTRAAADATIGFAGHAAVFNSRTWIGSKRYGFWEQIEPGAFAKTIGEADIKFLHNHNPDLLLARNTAGTLRLAEDDIGLGVDADIAPTSYGQDLAISLERGDVTQMSFAFDMVTYEWTTLDDGSELLTHREIALWDVSTVTYPAYADTDAALRADLLAAARADGFDAIDLERLALRLAEPDDAVVAALRALARDTSTPEPPEGTRTTSPPAPATGDDISQPAETTGERTSNPLALRMLRQRTAELEGAN